MSSYPNRYQHLKTNGTQCGSPALRRNRFCYFHKRYQEERIRLTADRRRAPATFFLPVLEDANSIQMSLMQIMRLLLTGQIEHKTASLLLYALQTASTNLRQTNFKPLVHEVILDPRDARTSLLDKTGLWNDEDFEEEEDEEEVDPVEQEIEEKCEEAARKARHVARWEAEKEIKARECARQRYEEEEKLKVYVQEHPEYMLVRSDGRLSVVQRPKVDEPQTEVAARQEAVSQTQASTPKHRTPESAAQVHERLKDMIRKELPALTKVYNEGMKKEAEEPARKKEPQKETMSKGPEKKSV